MRSWRAFRISSSSLGAALGLFIASLFIYTIMTPHKELALIRAGNPSAALAYGGVIVGLAIPLGSCLAHAFGLFDLLIWGVVTLLMQLLAFRFADIFLRGLPRRIAEGDVAAAVFLMSIKIGARADHRRRRRRSERAVVPGRLDA